MPILSFKPRALILSSFNQCTRNRAAVPRATWSRSTDRGHGRRSLCFASHKNKTLGLVLKFQLYRVVYQDNLKKKKIFETKMTVCLYNYTICIIDIKCLVRLNSKSFSLAASQLKNASVLDSRIISSLNSDVFEACLVNWELLLKLFLFGWLRPGGLEGGVLNKVLYGEASLRGPTPYAFINHFWQKSNRFRTPFIDKWYPIHIPTLAAVNTLSSKSK